MRVHKDTVIVIKSLNYSETDKILTLFGKSSGKFAVLAKGMRKIASKNRGNMQTMSMSNISFYKGQGMPILMETEGVTVVDFGSEDMKNLERVLLILNKLMPEESENPKVFSAVESMVTRGISSERVNKFRVLFLNEEGLLGDMGVCEVCGESESLTHINIKNFAMVCEKCYSKGEIDKGDLLELDKGVYANERLTKALDRYITDLIAQL